MLMASNPVIVQADIKTVCVQSHIDTAAKWRLSVGCSIMKLLITCMHWKEACSYRPYGHCTSLHSWAPLSTNRCKLHSRRVQIHNALGKTRHWGALFTCWCRSFLLFLKTRVGPSSVSTQEALCQQMESIQLLPYSDPARSVLGCHGAPIVSLQTH